MEGLEPKPVPETLTREGLDQGDVAIIYIDTARTVFLIVISARKANITQQVH